MTTFHNQPTSRVSAYSPLLYQVTNTNVAQTGFFYRFEIYIWTGAAASVPVSAQFTIDKSPRPDGKGLIDVGRYLRSYFNQQPPTARIGNDAPAAIDGHGVFVRVRCRGIWDASSDAFVASNTILAYGGYSIYNQRENYAPPNWTFTTPNGGTNSSYNIVTAVANNPYIVSFTNYGSNINGNLSWSLDGVSWTNLGAINSNHATTGSSMLAADVGPASIGTTASSYFVATRISTGDTVDVIKINVVCEQKYPVTPVYYLDQEGGISTMVFYGARMNYKNAQKQRFMARALEVSAGNVLSTSTQGSKRVFDVNVNERIVMNTGLLWPGESINAQVLSMARLIWIPVGEVLQPHICTTDEVQEMTSVNNQGNVNFTMEFQPAFNYLNDIR
jgi:hypothetical protein